MAASARRLTWDAERWPNFSRPEMACNCGCGMLPESSFMEILQRMRRDVGFALHVTSGARCAVYDASVGGKGPHTTGLAADISIRGHRAHKLLLVALAHGMTGIGVSQAGADRFLHLDMLPHSQTRPWVWSYR